MTPGTAPDDVHVPPLRIRAANDVPVRHDGDFVLYWMVANRRLGWNFALDQAAGHARELDRPLVILEGLRAGYPWASDRHHVFAIQGMAEHATRLAGSGVTYYPYVEPGPGDGSGLVAHLSRKACVVVTDESPAFFLPRMVDAAARSVEARLEVVDSCGLLPIRAGDRPFTTAYSFRRFLQRALPEHLLALPSAEPLDGLPGPAPDAAGLAPDWPPAGPELLDDPASGVAGLPIDHSVGPVPSRGGTRAAGERLRAFLDRGPAFYEEHRDDPDADAGSGLSPYLHWGHLSVHEVFRALADLEGWTPGRLSGRSDGKRSGWWGMSTGAEAFLDQIVTWRELCFNTAATVPGYDRYASLPDWALQTLDEHRDDPRPHLYDLDTLARAETGDPLWNAAQRQLLREGVIHNRVRMLWGKKILEWSATPEAALEAMIELNNRYAVDGRDPNSYGGIFWTLGRYDRGWPERAVFGKVRSMTSASMRRKFDVDRYLERYGAP